ncbi:MAG: hypothetical protein R2856_16435 [Caldilineaceae bacterium]
MACESLGRATAGHHVHRTFGQIARLLRRHDHILVVGQQDHGFGGHRFNRLQEVFGAGVHSLPATDDGAGAQGAEVIGQSVPRGDGHDAHTGERFGGKLRRRWLGGGGCLCELLELQIHVLDYDVVDHAQ